MMLQHLRQDLHRTFTNIELNTDIIARQNIGNDKRIVRERDIFYEMKTNDI